MKLSSAFLLPSIFTVVCLIVPSVSSAQDSDDPLASKWLEVRGSQVPKGTTAAGSDKNGKPLYVCRITAEKGVFVGWFDTKCRTHPSPGAVSATHVLSISPTAKWIQSERSKSKRIDRVVAGQRNDRDVGICRGKHLNGVLPSELWSGKCSWYGSKTSTNTRFEMLVDTVGYERQQAKVIKGQINAAVAQAKGALERMPNPLPDIMTAQEWLTILEQAKSNFGAAMAPLNKQILQLSSGTRQRLQSFSTKAIGSVNLPLIKAQMSVKAFIETETAMNELGELQAKVESSVKEATALEANDANAVDVLKQLNAHRNAIKRMQEKTKNIKTRKTKRDLIKRYRALARTNKKATNLTEKQLPVALRLKQLSSDLSELAKKELTVVKQGLTRLNWLFSAKDSPQDQLKATDLWFQHSSDAGQSLDFMELAFDEMSESSLDLKKLLAANHYRYEIASPPKDADYGEPSAHLYLDTTWAFGQLAGWVASDVLARAQCVHSTHDYGTKGTIAHLTACSKSMNEHKDSSILEDWTQRLRNNMKSRLSNTSAKECKKVLRKARKTPVKAYVKELCTELSLREKRSKKINSISKLARRQMRAGQFKASKKTIYKLYKLKPSADQEAKYLTQSWDSSIMNHSLRKNKKKAIARAKKMMRQLPAFEKTCKWAIHVRRRLTKQINAAVRRGNSRAANALNEKYHAAGRKACNAQSKVYEVNRIYKEQRNNIAAQSALRSAPTCVHSWTCR